MRNTFSSDMRAYLVKQGFDWSGQKLQSPYTEVPLSAQLISEEKYKCGCSLRV